MGAAQAPEGSPRRAGRVAASQPGPRAGPRASPQRTRRRPHLPGALRQPLRAPSPTWRARRASRTSQRDPAPLGTSSAGADGRRETLLGSRRRRACFVFRPRTANLLRSLSRPLGLRGAASAPQQHGGRGLRRKPGGGEGGDGPGS